MELKNKVQNSVIWVGSTRTIGQATSFTVMIVLARLLSPEDFGLMAIAMVFVGVVDHFSEFGLGEAIVQRKDLDEEDLFSAFWFAILIGLIPYLILFLGAQLIAGIYNRAELVIITRLLGLNFLLSSVSLVPRSLLIKELSFERLSKAELGSTVIYSLCTILLALKGYGVWSLVIGSLLKNLFLSILTFYYLPWKPRFIYSFKRVKSLLSFGIFLTGTNLLWYFYTNCDYLIVGRFLGTQLLGYYMMAYRLATFPIDELWPAVVRISYPMFSKLQDDKESLTFSFLRVTKYISLLSFPLFVGAIIFSRELVEVFLTSKWIPIVLPFQVLCGIGLLKSIGTIIPSLLNSIKRPDLNFIFSLISSIVMPIGFLIGVKHGIQGVSYAWIICYPFLFICLLSFGIRQLEISFTGYLRNLFPSIKGTLIMAILTVALIQVVGPETPVSRFVIGVLSGVISYVCFFAIFEHDLVSELKNNFIPEFIRGR